MFWVGVSDRVLLVLFLDADGTVMENGALGAAECLEYSSCFPFVFTLKWGVCSGLPFHTTSLNLHGKYMNLFGGTYCFNLHG